MAGDHFQTLRAVFRPWYIKVVSGIATLCAGIGLYASLQDQFPDKLPKLQDMVTVAHVLILPWWGWLLVLQAALGFGLYDYVRRTIGGLKPDPDNLARLAITRVEQHARRLARLEETSADIHALQILVADLRETVDALVRRQAEHVSTPELGSRLQTEIADLNNRLVARIANVESALSIRLLELERTTHGSVAGQSIRDTIAKSMPHDRERVSKTAHDLYEVVRTCMEPLPKIATEIVDGWEHKTLSREWIRDNLDTLSDLIIHSRDKIKAKIRGNFDEDAFSFLVDEPRLEFNFQQVAASYANAVRELHTEQSLEVLRAYNDNLRACAQVFDQWVSSALARLKAIASGT
jgi:hypothetical protein